MTWANRSFRRRRVASTFDAAHQVIESPAGSRWRWDAAGNLLQDDTHRYTWDARGRLVGVSGPEGRTRYGYDALGRRTTATTDGKTVRYVYDGDDVVQRIGADGTRTTYLRGPDGTPLASYSRRTRHGAAAGPVRQRRRRGGRRRCREALLLRPVRCDSACSGRAGIPWAAVRRLRSAGDGRADLRPDQWTVPVPGHVGDRGRGRRPVPVRPRRADRLHRSERTRGRVRRDGAWAGRCRRSGPAVAGTTTTPWRTRSIPARSARTNGPCKPTASRTTCGRASTSSPTCAGRARSARALRPCRCWGPVGSGAVSWEPLLTTRSPVLRVNAGRQWVW